MTGEVEPATPAAPVETDTADVGTPSGTADIRTAPERHRRSRLPLLLGALLLLLLTGVTGAVLLRPDGSDPSSSTDSSSETASPEKSESPSPSATTSPSQSQSPTQSSSSTTSPSPAAGAAQSVADYYTLLPGNPRKAWQMLSEDARAQAGGYDSYVGFWRTIGEVSVDAVSADGDVVTAQLTYTTDRGQEEETRQLEVERTGDDWLITEDLGAGGS